MKRPVVISTVLLLSVLSVVNLFFAPGSDTSLRVRSSLGYGPLGQAALVDLLRELGYPAPRSYTAPDRWAPDAVVWLIQPNPQRGIERDPPGVVESLLPWLTGGGTAVIFGLPPGGLPPLGIETQSIAAERLVVSHGSRQLELELENPSVFADAGRGRVEFEDAEGHPFVVVSELGEGRLVAVADARFLYNRHIADADDSVLAIDLVRRFGAPLLDEHFHGLRERRSLVEALGFGRIALILIPLFAGALAVARAASPWSPRRATMEESREVSLETFVDALASHYAKSRDAGAAFSAYREGFMHRLRRRTGSAEGIDDAAFRRRLGARPDIDAETRRWLLGDTLPRDRGELVAAVKRLEAFAGTGR